MHALSIRNGLHVNFRTECNSLCGFKTNLETHFKCHAAPQITAIQGGPKKWHSFLYTS